MIRPLADADEAAATRLLDETLGGRLQARMEELVDVLAFPALGAFAEGELAGVATYSVDSAGAAELVALAVATQHRRHGHGAALVDAVLQAAAAQGATRVWLVTTNDNLDALGVYQRQGFRLVEIRRDAVDRARVLKPEIPEVGEHGIALHDELVLEHPLVATRSTG
jgi:ribosomal protein S18 acetylase RimI-like enzyme